MLANDGTAPVITIAGGQAEIGEPVRLEWLESGATPEWLALDHPGLTRQDATGYHGEPQTRCTSIVVALREERGTLAGWSEPGAGDEHAFDHAVLTVRPATAEEAAPILAEEERTATTCQLLTRFRDLTDELDQAQDWPADPDLSHVDLSDCLDRIMTDYLPDYRGQKVRSVRIHRHLRSLDGYRVVAPGVDQHACPIVYPDPDRGVVWLNRGHNYLPRCYRLDGELAEIVEKLTPLLWLHGIGDTRTLTRDQVADVFGKPVWEVAEILRTHHIDPVHDGQDRYPRVQVLNAQRHAHRGGRR